MSSQTSSPERLDVLRMQNPELGFALYAMTPGGAVTLEVFTPDDQVFSFSGATAADALAAAFPETPPEPDPPPVDIFA